MAKTSDQSTTTTLEGLTFNGILEDGRGTTFALFVLAHPDGTALELRVPEASVHGRWPVPIGTVVDVEYRTNDLEAGKHRGYQSVTVLG